MKQAVPAIATGHWRHAAGPHHFRIPADDRLSFLLAVRAEVPPMIAERRLLQRVVAVAGIVPVAAGFYGVLFGANGIGSGEVGLNVSADSHFRYLSGLLTGIGILFWVCVPGIEGKTRLFRFLTLVVVLGGLARLLGLYLTGLPSATMLAALAMELAVTPLLCLWQMRIANIARERSGVTDLTRDA